MLLMYVLFSHKELLCFYKPLPLVPSDLLKNENIIGEWESIISAKADIQKDLSLDTHLCLGGNCLLTTNSIIHTCVRVG